MEKKRCIELMHQFAFQLPECLAPLTRCAMQSAFVVAVVVAVVVAIARHATGTSLEISCMEIACEKNRMNENTE